MAKLPDGWVFIPKFKDRITIEIDELELVKCIHCKHWIGGGIDEKDNFVPPWCTLINKPRFSDDWCNYAELKVEVKAEDADTAHENRSD